MSQIRIKPSHEGRLHKKLGVAAKKKIPPGRLAEALNSKSEELRREGQFAENAKPWNHR